MKETGAKIFCIDPRYTETAAFTGAQWVPIRPGTDMAFFLAIAHVLISESLFDQKFIAEKTSGFDELRAHVQKYTPEWAAKETEIPARDIRRLARELAAAGFTIGALETLYLPGWRLASFNYWGWARRA